MLRFCRGSVYILRQSFAILPSRRGQLGCREGRRKQRGASTTEAEDKRFSLFLGLQSMELLQQNFLPLHCGFLLRISLMFWSQYSYYLDFLHFSPEWKLEELCLSLKLKKLLEAEGRLEVHLEDHLLSSQIGSFLKPHQLHSLTSPLVP